MQNSVSSDDLTIFLAVITEGGFRAAARRLGMAPSNVSSTIARTEARLGVPLLVRTTRSIRATEQGRVLAETIGPHLAAIDAACAAAACSPDRISGRLTLNVPGAVVPDILPALLARFHILHPQVELEIVVQNDLVDIIAHGSDAGIRYGEYLEKDMISLPIGPRVQQFALAAAPAYLAVRGHPHAPAALTGHDAIRYRRRSGALLPWRLANGPDRVTAEPVTRLAISVDALHGGLGYARAGLGIIGAFRNWLEADFRDGTLVPVLPDWWPTHDGPRLYYPSRAAPAPLRAFIDMIRDGGSAGAAPDGHGDGAGGETAG